VQGKESKQVRKSSLRSRFFLDLKAMARENKDYEPDISDPCAGGGGGSGYFLVRSQVANARDE